MFSSMMARALVRLRTLEASQPLQQHWDSDSNTPRSESLLHAALRLPDNSQDTTENKIINTESLSNWQTLDIDERRKRREPTN